MLRLEEETEFGKVVAILYIGERYYMIEDENKTVSLIPAKTIEEGE